MKDLEQVADEIFAPEEAPAPEEVKIEAETVTVEAPEASPEPAPEPEAEAPQETPKEEHTVPLAKYLDTRDELKELRRFKAEQEAKAQAQPDQELPDPYDDPKGFYSSVQTEVQKAVTAQKFEISDVMARQAHGPEVVDKAAEWALERAKSDPGFTSQYMTQAHPIDWIVRQHQRDGFVSQLPPDVSSLDELIEREIAKRGLSAAPAAQAVNTQQAQRPAAPPRSLANAPSGGGVGSVPVGPVAGVDAVFPG